MIIQKGDKNVKITKFAKIRNALNTVEGSSAKKKAIARHNLMDEPEFQGVISNEKQIKRQQKDFKTYWNSI